MAFGPSLFYWDRSSAGTCAAERCLSQGSWLLLRVLARAVNFVDAKKEYWPRCSIFAA